MTTIQVYFHGIIALLLVWQCPIENCSAATLRSTENVRSLEESNDPFISSIRQKLDDELSVLRCPSMTSIFSIDSCINNVLESDRYPIDRRLSREEYIHFISLQTHGIISVETFSELPMNLVMYFNQVACECSTFGHTPSDCCVGDNAYIPLELDADTMCNKLGRVIGEACEIRQSSRKI